jgi:hypothetical protein
MCLGGISVADSETAFICTIRYGCLCWSTAEFPIEEHVVVLSTRSQERERATRGTVQRNRVRASVDYILRVCARFPNVVCWMALSRPRHGCRDLRGLIQALRR